MSTLPSDPSSLEVAAFMPQPKTTTIRPPPVPSTIPVVDASVVLLLSFIHQVQGLSLRIQLFCRVLHGVGVQVDPSATTTLKGMYYQLVEVLKPQCFQPRVNLMCSTCTALTTATGGAPPPRDWRDNIPISIYHLGWKQHLFWSQTPPIHPNIIHNVVTLVVKTPDDIYK